MDQFRKHILWTKIEQKFITNVVWRLASVTRARREQKITILVVCSGSPRFQVRVNSPWLMLSEQLYKQGYNTYVLDGDNVRHGLCADLSFSDDDRKENIRLISHMANLFVQVGVIVLNAFISQFCTYRDNARKIACADFHEIYYTCSIEVCEQRDVKSLYKRARAGEILHFTSISSPYEAPENPELVISTDINLDASIDEVYKYTQQAVQIKTG